MTYLCNYRNDDIFTFQNDVLFLGVKISCFNCIDQRSPSISLAVYIMKIE